MVVGVVVVACLSDGFVRALRDIEVISVVCVYAITYDDARAGAVVGVVVCVKVSKIKSQNLNEHKLQLIFHFHQTPKKYAQSYLKITESYIYFEFVLIDYR